MSYKIFLLFFFSLILFSCKTEKDRYDETEFDRKTKVKQEYTEKYNALSLDTLYGFYSFNIGRMLKENYLFQIDDYKLLDIKENNGKFSIHIYAFFPEMYLNLSCETYQVNEIIEHQYSSILLVILDSLERVKFSISDYSIEQNSRKSLVNKNIYSKIYSGSGTLLEVGKY